MGLLEQAFQPEAQIQRRRGRHAESLDERVVDEVHLAALDDEDRVRRVLDERTVLGLRFLEGTRALRDLLLERRVQRGELCLVRAGLCVLELHTLDHGVEGPRHFGQFTRS